MKKIINKLVIILLVLVGQSPWVNAQTNGISYQGVARTAAGNIVANQPIAIRFSILQGSAGGTMVYQEIHNVSTNSLGLFEVIITNGATTGTFDPLKWNVLASSGAFLKTELDITGGSAFVDMGTTQMLSVPFAMYSEKSGATAGAVVYKGTWDVDNNSPDLSSTVGTQGEYYVVSVAGNHSLGGITDWEVGDWAIYNGTVWQKVDNSQAPVTADAVGFSPTTGITATNVQGAIEELETGTDNKLSTKLDLSGGTMTGDLVLNADPTDVLGAATRQYVDAGDNALTTSVNAKVNRSGDTMTGDLVLNANPSVALGAATKQYVDDAITVVDNNFSSLLDSYIHKEDDGVSVYLPPASTRKRFGIGDTEPQSPLGIGSEGTEQRALTIKPSTLTPGQAYSFRLNATPAAPGFNLEEDNSTTGTTSRMFIQAETGYVGIGTTLPNEKLHIQESTASDITGIHIQNTATLSNQGWAMGHVNDVSVTSKDGAFSIFENTAGGKLERITVLPGGNMGINELIPDTKLHVSRPVADPSAALDLIEGTGIITIGPMTNNIVADYRGIQARTGTYVGSTVDLVASELNLQRLGGNILIHGDAGFAETIKGIITSDAKLGLGTLTPLEKIEIDGAIKIGTTAGNNDGTIRYTGSDFEGRKGGTWVSLTAGSGPWAVGLDNTIYYNAGISPKVGIGVSTPTAALDVLDNTAVTAGSRATMIRNTAITSSSNSDDNRIGLQILNNGSWGGNAQSKNIGLYVQDVSGQTNKEVNLAAVLNGNVVVGDISSSNAIGTNGKNVLAIQNGSVPTSAIGSTSNGGIQIYSDDISSGALAPPFSALHIMTGNGDVMKLYKTAALTVVDNTAISTTTYGPDVQAIIKNMRDRINDLETRLQALGLLQ